MVDFKCGYGQYLTVRFIYWAIFCFVWGMIFIALVVPLVILENPWWALSLILFLPLFFGCGIAILVNRRKKLTEMSLFLDDAKEYTAQATTEKSQRKVDEGSFIPLPTIEGKVIKFEFDFNGKKISKTAIGEHTFNTRYVGRYTDRKIRILYSPKYDFILILKDNAPKQKS